MIRTSSGVVPSSRHRGTRLGLTIFAALLVAISFSSFAGHAVGQAPALDQSNLSTLDGAAKALDEGKQLERDSRWLEAMSFYEKAIRKFPESETIKLRHTLAEIHCDLDRRNADDSYRKLLRNVNRSQALQTLNEIILKIETHFVDEPNWQRLAWRGTASLDIQLTKAEARRDFFPEASDEQIQKLRHVLRDDVNRRTVRSRQDVQNLAAYAGQLAQEYVGMKPGIAVSEYCCGAVASLDKYSTYLTGSQLDDVYNQIEGNFVGLGIELKAEQQHLLIVKVIPGGPAAQAGIVPGDQIVAVDNNSTESVTTERAAEMLKGARGSFVDVTLLGADGVRRNVRVRRDRVDVPSVEEVKIVDASDHVGYFRLTNFQKTTSKDVDEALWALHRQGMRSLIIDLRGNPGGLLTAAVEVADKFLTNGTIVSTRGRSTREDYDYFAHRTGTWRVPLVVLIDRDTASASEIVAGAIRDNGRGTIVGERSYGKGSVQGIFPLAAAKSGVRLTTAKFYSPNGKAISDRGVEPQQSVTTLAKPNTDSAEPFNLARRDDPVIAAGIETARQLSVAHR